MEVWREARPLRGGSDHSSKWSGACPHPKAVCVGLSPLACTYTQAGQEEKGTRTPLAAGLWFRRRSDRGWRLSPCLVQADRHVLRWGAGPRPPLPSPLLPCPLCHPPPSPCLHPSVC